MRFQGDERDPKRLMEQIPQEPMTADDPREDAQEEDVPEEDDERGHPDRGVGQPVQLEGERR